MVVLVVLVGVVPAAAWYLPSAGTSHLPKPTAAAVRVADRFARALFVTEDCEAAQALETAPDLVETCGHGSTRMVLLQAPDVIPGADFHLVRGRGTIVPRCNFVGAYARFGGGDFVEGDDSCIAYRLIAKSDVSAVYTGGYLVVYTDRIGQRWLVIPGPSIDTSNCAPDCRSLWGHRLPQAFQQRAPTVIAAAGRHVADRFVFAVFAKADCKAASAFATPEVGLEITQSDGCENADFLVRGSGIIATGCTGHYDAPAVGGNDTCILYQLISAGTEIPSYKTVYQTGYAAVYVNRTQAGWKVSGYASNDMQSCGSSCRALWARHEPGPDS